MRDRVRAVDRYVQILRDFDARHGTLQGLRTPERRRSFAEQVIDSVRRVEFVRVVRARAVEPSRADPASQLFDPVRAAIYHLNTADFNEAAWLVFLSVHFGKNRRSGWQLAREVYLGGGRGARWNWPRVSADPAAFRRWLRTNQARLLSNGGRFGNHRKYTSIDAQKPAGTGAAVNSYVDWVGPNRDHPEKFERVRMETTPFSPARFFDHLYNSLDAVVSFGRMAKFDYLTMIGKVGILDIEPGRAYLSGSTGPLKGARALFGSHLGVTQLEALISPLAAELGVGQQVMEDSICNWQKSPVVYRPFRG